MSRRRRLAFVVPGSLNTVTGGNLYDTYVIGALERRGWDVTVTEPGTDHLDVDVVVDDSLAFRYGGPRTDAPIVALAHQLPSVANRRPEWQDAERETLEAASLVVVVAEHLRNAVRSLTESPVEVVPPGRDHAWARDGASFDGNLVLCVANAEPGKGVPDVITAFVDARIPGAELVIAGDLHKDDEESHRIGAALSRSNASVRLAGIVSADVLAQLYAGARLFLTASRYEGWPIAVSEAMASGLPIVGFNAPGVRDLVRSGTDGLLVRSGDVAALSEAIRYVCDDRARARAMGTAARERALTWPTWEETGGRFARALMKLVR